MSAPVPFAPNPFSTRFVRPGALPYVFPSGEDVRAWLRRLETEGWWGQIIGPHGAGKSTLLAALIPAMEAAGRHVVLLELHDGQRRLPMAGLLSEFAASHPEGGGAPGVVVVDGYEQLGRLSRFKLKRFCRRRGCGLVVTSHVPVGLPTLQHVKVDLGLAHTLVKQLMEGSRSRIGPEVVEASFSRHQGNLREMFFELYDVYENGRS